MGRLVLPVVLVEMYFIVRDLMFSSRRGKVAKQCECCSLFAHESVCLVDKRGCMPLKRHVQVAAHFAWFHRENMFVELLVGER